MSRRHRERSAQSSLQAKRACPHLSPRCVDEAVVLHVEDIIGAPSVRCQLT